MGGVSPTSASLYRLLVPSRVVDIRTDNSSGMKIFKSDIEGENKERKETNRKEELRSADMARLSFPVKKFTNSIDTL